MRIWIQGETEMDCFLRKCCEDHGMAISFANECDVAVLHFPCATISQELTNTFSSGQKIICGILPEETERLLKKKNCDLFYPLKDEQYLIENANLTAEGAIWAAMNKMSIALSHAKCLVIGYGRIGKELTKKLRSLGAEVTVAARSAESREEAGENSIPISEIRSAVGKADLILNTVPRLIISENSLFSIKNTAFLLELASKPYGFDLQRAKAIGIRAYLESGLPGRYCPESAAFALYQFIERSVKIE